MDGNGDEVHRELIQELARRNVILLEGSVNHMIQEATALYRWILASLIAANGGAVLGLANAQDMIAPEILGASVPYFVGGIVAGILAALIAAVSAQGLAGTMGAALAHWVNVALSGEGLEDANKAARQITRKGLLWQAPAFLAGFISLGLFVAGALFVACALEEHHAEPDATSSPSVSQAERPQARPEAVEGILAKVPGKAR